MLYYPQLQSGSVCQFPVRRTSTTRTIANVMLGGDCIRTADPLATAVRWQLQYKNLTNDEWSVIEQLFESSEGGLGVFTFLDPAANLLQWTEDWTKANWSADPMLQAAPGGSDPLGGSGAQQITNSSQAEQRILQTIASGSTLQYCFSVYLRADVVGPVGMVVSGGEESINNVAVSAAWTRFFMSVKLSTNQDNIAFGLTIPAGARIDAFGPQVEAQPAAGQYKKTTDRSGVYASTRFDSDSLTLVTEGVNQNSATIALVSAVTH